MKKIVMDSRFRGNDKEQNVAMKHKQKHIKDTCLVFYYSAHNKNSFQALTGALENDPCFDMLDIYLVEKENYRQKLSEYTAKYRRIIMGFSFFTTQAKTAGVIVKDTRKTFPRGNITYVAGGPHPSGRPLQTLKSGFDIVVTGEGEEVFGNLCKKILSGQDYTDTGGIAYRKGNKYFHNPNNNDIDISKYPALAVKHRIFGFIEITRGCPWGCKFCQTSYLFGRRMRHRSISSISEYVKVMMEEKLNDIRFVTPNSLAYGSKDGRTMNLAEVEKLLRATRNIVKDKGRIFFGTFPSEIRPDFITKEALELLKEYCDNDNIIIGAQSGSSRLLKSIHRGHNVSDIYRAAELALKAGYKPNVDFIFGLPGETKQDFDLSFGVMQDLTGIGARIHGHTFMPLAGTPYAGAKTKRLGKKYYSILSKLVSSGKLYGSWEYQQTILK